MYASNNISISFILLEEVSAENSSMREKLDCLCLDCSTQLDSEICRTSKMLGLLSEKVFGKSKLQNVEADPDIATF